ncbi:MAG TPA: four helix bundle protein [Lacunisphaera sp.]|nr:four helix bundle protein [Lacunisphaera sp.]
MSKSSEDLEVWRRSRPLAVDVCRAFRECRDFGFRDQVTRAAVSVPSNIAEGAERNTRPEFVQFVGYAKGSLAELRTQLMIARDLEYLSPETTSGMLTEAEQLSRMLYRLAESQKTDSARSQTRGRALNWNCQLVLIP